MTLEGISIGKHEVASSNEHMNSLVDYVKSITAEKNISGYLEESSERLAYTLGALTTLGLQGKRVAELGPGGLGIACQELGSHVEAFDCSDWFKNVYATKSIPWNYIDLNKTALLDKGPYDIILLCEVIEHLCRWPVETLTDLRASLKPGGVLLVTTQNLHRLSARLRMILGRRLFAHFEPDELMMGHLREYTPEELEHMFHQAGFSVVKSSLHTFPDLKKSKLTQLAYKSVCHVRPRLSNFVFCWGQKNNELGS